ncbi:MAG: DUF1015 domain-containing protein [Dehalococcoidales bacterium]|nr:DUF1015 domain-containing protein [Dehalococcoidales bacterium]
MAEIRPFRGLRYNQSLVKDMSTVICPPYDVIPPSLHEDLHKRNDHNFIRLEDSNASPDDTPANNKYTRTAATLAQWLEQKILIPETSPAIYLHDHYFRLQGKDHMRRGIITRVRLEEWDKMIIRPHEGILSAPKEDRQNLLWALKVNTSPVLMMYQDPERIIASALAKETRKKPVINTTIPEGDKHKVWAITESEVINQIAGAMANQPFYIADGHHRYTSALTYRRDKMAMTPGTSSDDAVNFVMSTLVDFADPGLIILAPHRLIRGLSKTALAELVTKLGAFFEVTEMPANTRDAWQKLDAVLSNPDGMRLGFYSTDSDKFYALKLRNAEAMAEIMPLFHSELYRKLDVSVLDHLILEKILGLGVGGSDEVKISFSTDREEAVKQVNRGEHQLVFFLKPVKPELIKAVADANDKMPRKSTYFYPKAPAGLVVNPLFTV